MVSLVAPTLVLVVFVGVIVCMAGPRPAGDFRLSVTLPLTTTDSSMDNDL